MKRAAFVLVIIACTFVMSCPFAFSAWNGGHAVEGCTSSSTTWYFAEGTTRNGFNEWVCILNPNSSGTTATFTYMLGTGDTIERTYDLPGGSRTTVDVNAEVGDGQDVSIRIAAGARIVAERPMYFRYKGVWTGGHTVAGAQAPRTEWYFAEGSSRPGFDTYMCLQNPTGTDALVEITYMLATGDVKSQELTVEKQSRSTVVTKEELGEGDDPAHDFSAKVESLNGTPIVAERPMYFSYKGVWTGGHTVVGAQAPRTGWYFAEGSCRPGFDTYFCIQNPDEDAAKVEITYMPEAGGTRNQLLRVDGRSRRTVVVKELLGEYDDSAHDFSARVKATNSTEIVVERSMYFSYKGAWTGGHAVVGAAAPDDTFYFAEGSCRPGFDSYLCIQNPDETEARVTVTYSLGDGGIKSQALVVGANSRHTVEVKQVLGEGNDGSHDFSVRVEAGAGSRVIVERPTYFNYYSTGHWSLAAVGDVNLGGDVSPTLASLGFAWPWSAVGDLLRSTTLTFANLECTMSYSGSPVGGKTFTFRGDPAALPFMNNEGGVDVVSLANNHARDYGAQSLLDSLTYLDSSGIAHCGAGADYESAYTPAYLDAKGLRIAFLAYDEIGYSGYSGWYAGANHPGVCNAAETGRIASDIYAAKESADLVIVSFHWGTELKTTPDSNQTALAHYAVDCGADLVLGHHPHVVQGFEFYHGKLIANSLGNFVFNPGSERARYTVLARLDMDSRGFTGATVYPVYISSCRPQLMGGAEGGSWISQVAALSQALGVNARVSEGVMYFP